MYNSVNKNFYHFSVPPSDLLLRLGEYDLAEEEEPYGYQERRVQIVASHPQFDPRTFEYDLALLRFYEPVEFQPNIIPVCVPETDENFIGRTAFVTGWGRLYEGLFNAKFLFLLNSYKVNDHAELSSKPKNFYIFLSMRNTILSHFVLWNMPKKYETFL